MGKHDKKSAKGRLDKFYHLAKEQGYRSRAAYKLIQLNKKYDFLSNARVVIDLCAAPGGWLQVASKYTPVSSLLIGVDLDPIKPVPRAVTFVEDITTQRCRKQLKAQMKTWKADVVLHDGAPNMGNNWVQDAFTQSELVLQAMKLATEFLKAGGTFVTKVFRSQDYNSLLWIFNQLFKKVEATKPQASRNASAEIFVVCQGYKAPTSIDPKMLDPVHIFQGVDKAAKQVGMETLMKEQKKKPRMREGYDDDATKTQMIFKARPVTDFVETKDPIPFLLEVNSLTWPTENADLRVLKSVGFYKSLPFTTTEIIQCTADLRVLGKKDFKGLMKWRTQIREFMAEAEKKEKIAEAVARGETVLAEEEKAPEKTEDEKMAEELEERQKKLLLKKRREKKLRREKMAKLRQRIALNIVIKGDVIEAPQDQGLFDLHQIKGKESVDVLHAASAPDAVLEEHEMQDDIGVDPALRGFFGGKDLEMITGDKNADSDSDSGEDKDAYRERLEEQLDAQYDRFREGKSKDARVRIGKKEKKPKMREIDMDLYTDLKRKEMGEDVVVPRPNVEGEGEDSPVPEAEEQEDNSLIQPLLRRDKPELSAAARAKMWFDNDLFRGVDEEVPATTTNGKKRKRSEADLDDEGAREAGEAAKKARIAAGTQEEVAADEDDAAAASDEEELATEADKAKLAEGGGDVNDLSVSDVDSEEFEEVPKTQYDSDEDTNIECLAIAQLMLKKKKDTLVDDSYNRRAFNDDNLPTWFADEEKMHNKAQMPITKEMVTELKQLYKNINARPIAKVAEAKARKRKRALLRAQKMHKQAASLADNEDIDDKSKMKAIERLYKKGASNKMKPSKTYVVAKRGAMNGKRSSGKVKIVDRRLKADMRKGRAKAITKAKMKGTGRKPVQRG